MPHSAASDAEDPLSLVRRLPPTSRSGLVFDLAVPSADADLEGCLLGMGDAEREAKGESAGEADGLVVAAAASGATLSLSSRPEMRRGARGRREELAGVELVRDELPCRVFMAVRGRCWGRA